ncbi:CheB methylesterase domain-containing protein, partial [Methanospirillum hungatei]|uniref:CheB methylesterase domain-containing protein n=1 Tax=Methanospirillum hungatei TaxID=2203 RepID=UPI002D0254AA
TSDLRFSFSISPPEHNLRPSVSYLFRSAAKNLGSHVLGILLSGMGSDGAEELLQIRQNGGCTIIQDRDSSFVYGMPGAAEMLNAGMFSLPPVEIARFLRSLPERRQL